MQIIRSSLLRLIMAFFLIAVAGMLPASATEKQLAYLVSDIRIPFWDILQRGITREATKLGYQVDVYSAENNIKRELENTVKALNSGIDGLIISPINSSTAVTILKLAKKAGIPVVIADIGSDSGEYVSYISSDNYQGSYELGKILARELKSRQWQNGTVGIIAIPQKRANGQARTAGFMKALEEHGIKGGDIRQQVDFSYQETYDHARDLIASNKDLRALWLQGSDRYQGALDAIADSGKEGEILLICFDAEPVFLDMIPRGELVGAGMQQPFLMGEKAVDSLHDYLQGKQVEKNKMLEVLPVSGENIKSLLPGIRRNVLGLEN